ncbi:MAG: hypothetical protein AAFR82_11745 [Pseudomonadota bacterium]
MTPTRRLSYWIVPCAEDSARYFEVIKRLALNNNSRMFAPHVSLASIEGEQPDLKPCLDSLAGLVVNPVEIDMTDAFNMSLFVRLERHPALLKARAFLKAQPGANSSRAFDPHLSLYYGMAPAGAADWDMVRALLDHPVRFVSLHAVAIPPRVETQDDVKDWNALQTYPF